VIRPGDRGKRPPRDSEPAFGTDNDGRHEKALKKLGIDLSMLSSEAGHA